jgi:hypothetical protein
MLFVGLCESEIGEIFEICTLRRTEVRMALGEAQGSDRNRGIGESDSASAASLSMFVNG